MEVNSAAVVPNVPHPESVINIEVPMEAESSSADAPMGPAAVPKQIHPMEEIEAASNPAAPSAHEAPHADITATSKFTGDARATGATNANSTSKPERSGRWTEREKALFREGFKIYGSASFRWKRISEFVGTRNAIQCKTHHQKLIKMKRKRGNSLVLTQRSSIDTVAGIDGEGARLQSLLNVAGTATSTTAAATGDHGDAPPGLEIGGPAVTAVVDTHIDPMVRFDVAQPSAELAAAVANLPDDHREPESPASGRWTEREKELFLEAMEIYGRGRWKLVSRHVGTRTSVQCKTHHQKVSERKVKLEKQEQVQSAAASATSRESIAADAEVKLPRQEIALSIEPTDIVTVSVADPSLQVGDGTSVPGAIASVASVEDGAGIGNPGADETAVAKALVDYKQTSGGQDEQAIHVIV